MSNEQIANWLLREASRRQLLSEESAWLDQYYWSYREEPKVEETPQSSHGMFWFSLMFLCGVSATLVILVA